MCDLITKQPSSSFYLIAFDDNKPYGSRDKIVKIIARLNGNTDKDPDISQYRVQKSLYYIKSTQQDIEKEFINIDSENDDILIIPITVLGFGTKITWSKHSDSIMSKLSWYASPDTDN